MGGRHLQAHARLNINSSVLPAAISINRHYPLTRATVRNRIAARDSATIAATGISAANAAANVTQAFKRNADLISAARILRFAVID